LRQPWGFAPSERKEAAAGLLGRPPRRAEVTLRGEPLILRGRPPSKLGRALESPKLWDGNLSARQRTAKDHAALLGALLGAAEKYGLVIREPTAFGGEGWRLRASALRFKLGDGKPRARSASNKFFTAFYRQLAKMLAAPQHPLFGFEAREH